MRVAVSNSLCTRGGFRGKNCENRDTLSTATKTAMKSSMQGSRRDLSKSWPADLGISSPFTIPSGIVTTVPAVIARIARDVPEIGFLITKTLSVAPREGYREPVIHEYHPGCFVNAVGLGNPGATKFMEAMKPLLPLHNGKPLFVSIMGNDPQEFLECAYILDTIADAFELNLSCPHVKGAGQTVGSDPETVRYIIGLLKDRFQKPIIPKLSPNIADISAMARLCRDAGADGLSLINTVGPGVAVDSDGNPILTNVAGGLSGAGILPVGLKAVREASEAVGLPIIASGGIAGPRDVRAYRKAGASLFAVGSALAGMTTPELIKFFSRFTVNALDDNKDNSSTQCLSASKLSTTYFKTTIVKNVPVGFNLFKLEFMAGPSCNPGSFFFLRLPEMGEKPFSPMSTKPPTFLVRSIGPFTRCLQELKPGDSIYLRGPYGKGFPQPESGRPLVLVSGGTGVAPIIMAANRWTKFVAKSFAGFSTGVGQSFRADLEKMTPGVRVLIDPPDQVGEVVKALAEDLSFDRQTYKDCRVFMCGPSPMMEAACEVLQGIVPGERIFMAREDIMRCGIGLCGSCGTGSGLRSCVDGPVMHQE